ncbi:MAG: universal stress protein [Rhodospirillales bacterium]|nr:universal stress protein [Rhodospirillales bacterium]MCB9995428.1 universal stress protein [Rhodospirillales bacterium]
MPDRAKREEELAEGTKENRGRRGGDGGVYLVVSDGSEEFQIALRYAARRAETARAHVGILHVINVDDFQHWGNVEAVMRKELREGAEKELWNTAKAVNDLNGQRPVLYMAEGNRTDVIIDTINEDDHIRMLILGGGTTGSGPGPLVQHFTGKGLAKLRVPVLVVPGHIEAQNIDGIAL